MDSFTLLTPTFGRDLRRFAVLRESMERCGMDAPHVAVVHTEDMEAFRKLPWQKNLRFVSTAEVLPKHIERRRRVKARRRRNPLYWMLPRHVGGWVTQQIVKLSAAQVAKTDAVVVLDSETFFIRPLAAADVCAPDGRPYLFEAQLTSHLGWAAHAKAFLGIPDQAVGHRYVFQPTILATPVLRRMSAFIEKKYSMPWQDAFLSANVTEYAMYGHFARHIDELAGVVPRMPETTLEFWVPDQTKDLTESLPAAVRRSAAKMVHINSNAGVSAEDHCRIAQLCAQQCGVA